MSGISQVNRYTHTTALNSLNLASVYEKERQASLFGETGKVAYKKADELTQIINSLKSFIDNLNNPSFCKYAFVSNFKQILNNEMIYKTLCSEVSLAIKNVADEKIGEQLLNENFFVILRLKDSNGRNPLDKIVEEYTSQAEIYRSIGALSHLASYLVLIQVTKEKAQFQPSSYHTQQFNESKQRAYKWFEGLKSEDRNPLCREVWEIDEKPPILDYGYTTIKQNVEVLLELRGKCIIADYLNRLEAHKETPFVFKTHDVCPMGIEPSDNPETIKNVQIFNYLCELRILLENPSRNKDFIAAKHQPASPNLKAALKEVKELIHAVITISSYKTEEGVGFGEHLLKTNPWWLVKSQSFKGESVLNQLISHFGEKVQLCRVVKELEKLAHTESLTQRLDTFRYLSSKAKEGLAHKVWYYHGGKDNPDFGEWGYGTNAILSNAHCLFQKVGPYGLSLFKEYQRELESKFRDSNAALLAGLKRSRALPEQPIDVSTEPLQQEPDLIKKLPANVRVAVVTAEFGPIGIGGLRPAVTGMVHAFGRSFTRVIMPLYRNGPIKEDLINGMRETDHEIFAGHHRARVMKTKIDGVRCYFIDGRDLYPNPFWIPKKTDGVSSGNFYEGDYHHVRYRWAFFQKAAADLCYLFNKKVNPVQLVHCHDAQTGLVPKFLKDHHQEDWERGETSVVHFTYHNNAEPMRYEDGASMDILVQMGLERRATNSFVEALQIADVISTVSPQFGKESQMLQSVFGNGLHEYVKKAALEKTLFGILNGNTDDYDPRKNEQLKNWISVLPETRGAKVDLRFGPKSSVEELARNTVLIQREQCAYLKSLDPNDPAYADLDPTKPTLLYVGRYDTRQKGISKLPLIMKEAIACGAQFICVGIEPDDEAKCILEDMKQYAKARGKKGVLVLEDLKVEGKFKYQGVFGILLRCGSIPVVPSGYEPGGLIPNEGQRFGVMPIATGTGGLANIILTHGPNRNGYLFKRCDNWDSPEQDEEIRKTLREALKETFAIQEALYSGNIEAIRPHMERKKLIMKNALNSTWEKTPDGSLSPIMRRQLVDAKGFQNLKLRGGSKNVNLETLTF